MRLSAKVATLNLNREWKISNATAMNAKKFIIVEISKGKIKGFGEASPSVRFLENIETTLEFLEKAAKVLGDDPTDIKGILQRLDEISPNQKAAKAAIDMALYDINGKLMKKPVCEMLYLDKENVPPSSKTLSLAQLENIEESAKEFIGYPLVKVKLDKDTPIKILDRIHEITKARLYIDINEDWEVEEAITKISEIEKRNFVEFIEQPIKAGDVSGIAEITKFTKLPVILDEDIVNISDIYKFENKIAGINIKLQKVGGIYRAIEMITAARRANMKVLIGCRIESSLGITAAAHLMPLADYVDLDSIILLERDPFKGAYFNNDKLVIPNLPGIGAVKVEELH